MLERRGGTGRLVALELKMLTRNRRPRAMVALAVAMVPLLIAFEAYWLHTMPDRSDIYPIPEPSALSSADLRPADPTLQRVTFDVVSRSVPENAWPYVTGSDPALGSWDPAVLPLLPAGQGRWQRVVYLPRDSLIEYRLTLGSWDAHRLHADGSRPPRGTLLVDRDTTLALTAERWRYPLVFTLVDVNLIYIGILLTGFFLLTYGQLLLGWDAGYLEGIFVRPVHLVPYLTAKHGILVASVIISCVVALPLGFVKPWFIVPTLMLALYNAGVNALVLLLFAPFSTRAVDLNASAFSMQGKGAVQILVLAPVLLVPLLVYAACALAGVASWVYWILGAAGAAALIVHRRVVERAAALLVRRKHRTVAVYRMS